MGIVLALAAGTVVASAVGAHARDVGRPQIGSNQLPRHCCRRRRRLVGRRSRMARRVAHALLNLVDLLARSRLLLRLCASALLSVSGDARVDDVDARMRRGRDS